MHHIGPPGSVSTLPEPRLGAATLGVEVFGWAGASALAAFGCFDHWRLRDGRQALFLGEAHGGPAGSMEPVPALLRALSEEGTEPEWLLARVNARLHELLEPPGFVTAFMGCLGADGWLSWCSAGQGPVYVRRRAGEEYDALPAEMPPLGIDAGLQPQAGAPLALAPGGRVAVFSDGILDADNGAGQVLGPRRVKTVLDNTGSLPLEKVVGLIRDVLVTWQGSRATAGDQSILIAGLPE